MTAYKKNLRGFTLIELLIVMAILGVLAVVVLVAVNPAQQLARTRDAGRKSGIAQIGRAMEAYYTSHGGSYITGSTTWLSSLVTSGEISTAPAAITGSTQGYTNCTENVQNAWCYAVTGGTLDNAVIYTVLESASESSKCTSGEPVFAWSTADGRGGLICDADLNLDPGTQTWNATQ